MNLFDKGLKPLTISTALYKSVKTVIKHSMRNCTFTTTIYKTVKIERFTFVIVRLKAARLVNCTILGGSVFQIFAVLLIKRYLSTSLWDTNCVTSFKLKPNPRACDVEGRRNIRRNSWWHIRFSSENHVDAPREPPLPHRPHAVVIQLDRMLLLTPPQNQLQMLPFVASGGRVLVITESVDSAHAYPVLIFPQSQHSCEFSLCTLP